MELDAYQGGDDVAFDGALGARDAASRISDCRNVSKMDRLIQLNYYPRAYGALLVPSIGPRAAARPIAELARNHAILHFVLTLATVTATERRK